MAQSLQIQGRFGYRRVTLDKTEANSLGIGSYGAVYRARCDQLPCAAKVLHPILFSTRDPASRRIVQRFEQECQFLSEMRHPNIIQYLGTCHDLQTGLPILFMELMDESLTCFLEHADASLPLRVQVSIAYDVAQALAYLHSHEIIHRDLSSNNVLLISDSRAKVTDFGMSKLTGMTQMTTPLQLTHLPGTEVYMPPEAFQEPPEYSNKLDCFSLGVLGIQIMTRKFPRPGPRRTIVEVPKSELFPFGRAERLVSEVDRRKEHIATIPDQESALLHLSLDCLKDDCKDRPSSVQLCSRLAAMKELPQYHETVELTKEPPSSTFPSSTDGCVERLLQEDLEQAMDRVLTSEHLVAEFQEMLDQKDVALREQEKTLSDLEEKLQLKDITIRAMEEELQEKAKQIRELQGLDWEDGPDTPILTYGECSVVCGDKAYFCDGYSQTKILEYDSKTRKWCVIECPKKSFSIAIVNGLLTAIGGEVSGKSLLSHTVESRWFGFSQSATWVEKLPSMRNHHKNPAVTSTSTSLIVAGSSSDEMAATEVLDIDTLQWSTVASFACPLTYASAAIHDDHIYLGGGFLRGEPTKSVLRCRVRDLLLSRPNSYRSSSIWSHITELPVSFSTLIVFQDRLLAVGGQKDGSPTTAVYLYDVAKQKWRVFTHMNEERFRCMATILPGGKLMVVGGDTKKTSVELASLMS